MRITEADGTESQFVAAYNELSLAAVVNQMAESDVAEFSLKGGVVRFFLYKLPDGPPKPGR